MEDGGAVLLLTKRAQRCGLGFFIEDTDKAMYGPSGVVVDECASRKCM